jgi:hypothetical protein
VLAGGGTTGMILELGDLDDLGEVGGAGGETIG